MTPFVMYRRDMSPLGSRLAATLRVPKTFAARSAIISEEGRDGMKTALKEWAVVVEALAEGRQTFLLRKGGIAEGKRGFELKHDEFVFFPTWEHQHARSIRPEFHKLFEKVKPPDPNVLEIRYLAQVTDVLRAPVEMEAAQRLARYHIWAEPFVRMRYEYRPDLPLFIVVPRIFRLPRRVQIPHDRRYAGCRSWVTFYEDVDVAGRQPVLSRNEFQSARGDLLASLAGTGAVSG